MRYLVIVPTLMFSLIVHADPARTPDAKQMHTDDCAQARKHNKACVIDMGKGEDIGGKTMLPNGVGVGVLIEPNRPSLVRVRKDFIVEILKTAEEL